MLGTEGARTALRHQPSSREASSRHTHTRRVHLTEGTCGAVWCCQLKHHRNEGRHTHTADTPRSPICSTRALGAPPGSLTTRAAASWSVERTGGRGVSGRERTGYRPCLNPTVFEEDETNTVFLLPSRRDVMPVSVLWSLCSGISMVPSVLLIINPRASAVSAGGAWPSRAPRAVV